jgi:hypothetical protein
MMRASCNAAKCVYPETEILMCWYHLKARIDIHIKDIHDKALHNGIAQDI